MFLFTEFHNKSVGLTIKPKNVYSIFTKYQKLTFLETEDFGKVLVLDDLVQLTERDEFIYHEMISHVAINTFPRKIEKVLIIGGGDGGTAREVLKYDFIKEIHLVEIDKEVIEIAKKHMPFTAKAFEDKRLKVFIEDGRNFVRNTQNKYDVVLVDCSDPIGPSKVLFEKDFYQDCFKILKEDGIFVTQSESPFYSLDIIKDIIKNLKISFPIVKLYTANIPTYPAGYWSFTLASKVYDPLKVDMEKLKDNIKRKDLKYYNEEIHFSSFALPSYVKERLKEVLS
ncbi:MAG TPA: polyamine aminopropyltransferase [Desulfurobacteriaceae bacterium]|nr:polyamine aminopropyltransferase [Desulfurobacteriaceae bacterium]